MQEATVKQVLDSHAKTGVSASTGKEWSMSRVELSNSENVFIFNPIQVGDLVESKQNGTYINWSKKKVDPKQGEIMSALRQIYELLTIIKNNTVPSPALPSKPVQKAPEEPTEPYKPWDKWSQGDTPVKSILDEPIYPSGEEPINIDDIPF